MIDLPLPPPPELAVLAGAGISRDAPSNLPDGGTFMRELLRRLAPPGVDPEWVASVMRLPDARLRRPGELLRFEALMHTLRQQGLDPDLRALDCYDRCEHPNLNHFILADLIRCGAIVITTNFDRLIEIAWSRLPATQGRALAVAAFDEDYPRSVPAADAPPTLWKIHGSLSVGGRDTRASVQATMTSMLSSTMTAAKRDFLSAVLRSRDLVVVGYSGSDDLDIVPVLADSPSRRWLFWIEHTPADQEPRARNATELQGETPLGFESDAVGRDRVWFVTGAGGDAIRVADRALLVSAHTRSILERLAPADGYPVEGQVQFAFGPAFEAETRAFFEAWERGLGRGETGRCEAVVELFQTRRFRPEVRARLAALEKRLERLRGKSHDPHDRLSLLNEEYNALGALSEDDPSLRRRLVDLRTRVEAIEPADRDRGWQRRLLACIAWTLKGGSVGGEKFAEAAHLDRAEGYRESELATLTTWRSHAGYGPLGDHIPAAYSRRIDEIGEEIGYLPVVWQQELRRHSQVIDDTADLLAIYAKLSRMLRHAVDIGDVQGEAEARLQVGRLYLLDQQPGLAAEEFVRVEELNRLLQVGRLESEAGFFLQGCEQRAPGWADRLRPAIRRSMWAGRD